MKINVELDAHEVNLVAAGGIEPYITQKQCQVLARLMGEVFPKRWQRIEALNLIAGKAVQRVTGITEITTTKNLTSSMASYLINQLKDKRDDEWTLSRYGREFLEGAKTLLEIHSVSTENNA